MMTEVSALELEHCRELAVLPGSLFEFTSRFLPADRLEPMLALYALKQLIGSIPSTPTDDSVKWAKLKWWSEELVADSDSPSRHPVLRLLSASGARAHLNNSMLQRLVNDAAMQIDTAANSDVEEMFERMADAGATGIELELALDAMEIDTHSLRFLGAASMLFSLVSDFAANNRSGVNRIPLNIMAKYNVSADQLEQGANPLEMERIVKSLAENCLEWFSAGLSGLQWGAGTGTCAHLQLSWAMTVRRLAAVTRDTNGFLDAGKRYGPADAWHAWRFLRRLK